MPLGFVRNINSQHLSQNNNEQTTQKPGYTNEPSN